MPCSVYFSQFPFDNTLNVKNDWIFQVNTGFNYLLLSQVVTVSRGDFLLLNQTTGRVAIDTTGTALCSDLYWSTKTQWTRLPGLLESRFYLTPLTNFSSYITSFSFSHTYKTIGLYNILITFSSDNQLFQQIVNITDRNTFFVTSC